MTMKRQSTPERNLRVKVHTSEFTESNSRCSYTYRCRDVHRPERGLVLAPAAEEALDIV